MIRVLHCVGAMNMGGIETMLMSIYRTLNRDKIQFDFLVGTQEKATYDDEIKELGGSIYPIPPRRNGLLASRNALRTFFIEHTAYQIIHQHASSLSYVTPLQEAQKAGLPCRIIHSHSTKGEAGSVHQLLHKWNQRTVHQYATHYFACSQDAARWLYPATQFTAGNYRVIRNAVDIDKFQFDETARVKIRKEFQIADDIKLIGHIGRFAPSKNHSYLISIFKAVHDQDPNTALLLVGDGPLRAEVEAQVATLGMSDFVYFTGLRKDTPSLYSAMDVFVFPSLFEGLGIVLVEAQVSGVACLTSADVVPKEAKVLQDRFSFLFLSDAPREWVNAILSMPLYPRNGDCAQKVGAVYDIRNVTQELENFYLNIGTV